MNLCSVENCQGKNYSLDLCSKHYQRLKRTGSVHGKTAPYADRFWASADKSGDCWEWTGHRNHKGYGTFSGGYHPTITTRRAHRIAFELSIGPIPAGLQVDHTCRNRACVRPEHLRLASNKENAENKSPASELCTSGIRGVRYRKERGNWRGLVIHQGKTHYAGSFPTPELAGVAVTALRNKLFTHNDEDRRPHQ